MYLDASSVPADMMNNAEFMDVLDVKEMALSLYRELELERIILHHYKRPTKTDPMAVRLADKSESCMGEVYVSVLQHASQTS